MHTNLTAIQLDALRAYAKAEGANWKAHLVAEWAYGSITGPLQTIRNQFGPSWLMRHGSAAIRSEVR